MNNLKLFKHCLIISNFYKRNSLKECLNLLKTKSFDSGFKAKEEVSATYLSKRIRFFNKLIASDNCLANSMCLYLAFNNKIGLSLKIGASNDLNSEVFSHCWIEKDGLAINEDDSIKNLKILLEVKGL